MLRPSKHAHPDKTVIAVALNLLSRLRNKRLCEYESLRSYSRRSKPGSDPLFLPALNFLYLMGLVEYHPKTDALEYVGRNEAI
ncbi:ABC-three component system middle component 8 [Asticcacaulis sp.]|uniref:ABC-three component system middle component 8 n=1 Tax=Asticcacaulis sp. TaxID=1872648 RepID=UPI002BD5C492|nr:ABC-three component system middle component 8 [Asticcacaulis sp.]HTM81939.1 ABC-three component system middle component 8 [Asticcacaulis sp.]